MVVTNHVQGVLLQLENVVDHMFLLILFRIVFPEVVSNNIFARAGLTNT